MKLRRSHATQKPESKPAAVLARQCERALVAAARSARISTRRRIHQAARDFIRRHARNRAYLAWVMQRVAANAALAIALLGLGQGVARAGAPVFDPFPTNPAPFDGTVLGGTASPAIADLDSDGDLDLLVGSLYSFIPTTRYFENTGSANAPAYVERTGVSNPLLNTTLQTMPTVGDLNGDGKLDLVTVSSSGSLAYYVNIGSPVAPGFLISPTDPFGGQSVGFLGTPSLGDLDGDGDLDLVSGNLNGQLLYLQNTGTATAPAFVSRVGSANPLSAFTGSSSGPTSQTSPALGDFDGDGDPDVAIGTASAVIRYLENTGDATSPAFRELLQAANPFRGEVIVGRSRLAVADLDADGDLDVVQGNYGGGLTRLMNQFGRFVKSDDTDPSSIGFVDEGSVAAGDFDGDGDTELFGPDCTFADNTGSPTNPRFVVSTLPGFSCTTSSVLQQAIDLDLDGDLDIVGGLNHWLNTGTRTNPQFSGPTPLSLPQTPGRAWAGLSFGDLDRDGDSDVVSIEVDITSPPFPASSRYFERLAPLSPLLLQAVAPNPLPLLPVNVVAFLSADVDGDGDIDGSTTRASNFTASLESDYLENTGSPTSPAFARRTGAQNPFDSIPSCTESFGSGPFLYCAVHRQNLADIDGDGDLDTFAIAQDLSNSVPLLLDGVFIENSIIRPSPRFNGPIVPLSGALDAGSFSSLGAGDLDGDGDPDLVASESFASGALRYYQNKGTATAPQFFERFGSGNPFTGLNAGSTPILVMGDLDSDGDLDLLAGEAYGNPLQYFQNTGTATAPAFIERAGPSNPVDNVVVERSAPALGDLDRDGDLDLVIGSSPGTFRLFRNTGNAGSPAFTEITGTANPFNGLVAGVGFVSNPALGDIDLDGDLDLLSGDETTGGFHYFENTGTATAPAFVARTGSDNPANGKSVGLNSTPALVDLDADGDLDLVSGDRDGKVETYVLPEPSKGILLTAGIAFLGWLRRMRSRTLA